MRLSQAGAWAMIGAMSSPKPITLYGIPNCDTVKKARAWLTEHGVAYEFHDFKKQGVTPEQLSAWCAAVGWEVLLNRRGTTWRQLDAAEREGMVDAASARAALLAHASLIKRPVVDWGAGQVTVGFDAEAWLARQTAR